MLTLLLLNAVAVAAAYLILGVPAARMRAKLDAAGARLRDATVEKGLAEQFIALRKSSAKTALGVFWLWYGIALAALYMGFSAYATFVEPRAALGSWLMIDALLYGLAAVGVAVLLSMLIAVYWQAHRATDWLADCVSTYPNSPVVREVRDMVTPKAGEIGVAVVASLAVTGCLFYGLGLIAIFYTAAQTAIECARSSKCM